MAKPINFYFFGILFSFFISVPAQDTIRLSRQESEAVFLSENLSLLAEKLNIPKAEAAVQQAKLWPNPNLTFDQVNFWATDRQTGGQEVSPPLWDGFGKNQQFAFEIEQLIYTAGKRKKIVALEKVSVDQSKQYFEDLLRNLKIEFRSLLTDLQYIQLQQKSLKNLFVSVQELTNAYERQFNLQNISKSEYARLKAKELELRKEIFDLQKSSSEVQKELKILLHQNPNSVLVIADEGFEIEVEESQILFATDFMEQVESTRPDLQLAVLEEDYFSKLYDYERAQRVPDFSLKATYDRNGSTMLDFVGFGISIDLPVFNRNQGNIKIAQLGIEQSKIQTQRVRHEIQSEIFRNTQDLLNAIQLRDQIKKDYNLSLDELLSAHNKNLKNRNISMLEYLDFVDAYLDNQKTVLDVSKEVNDALEELNFAVGKDILENN
ncbi:TolC family protein [Moheibacter sediminis]|uniref:Outer membrane protein, cobalt-zinc-cadmium efflux system n=1 Tax=Moheibacter sediminis TaxID=1434700 RepID=A0A1W2A9E7_9FLAO|nr:TolC family protein [Moheibacter sediminis]SMC57369.1 outer membrane protein, cobalt-zinc-cadmium efflux system [Moheibacter sediminis]